MDVTARVTAALTITQTPDATAAPLAATNRGGITFSGGDTEYTLNGSTTPALATKAVDLSQTFGSTSPVSKDLTAAPLAEDSGDTIDLTGKKLVGYLLSAPTANNTGGITVAPHASNGYNLWGTSGGVKIYPGETILVGPPNGVAANRPAVGGSAKIIELTPSATADVLTFKALFA